MCKWKESMHWDIDRLRGNRLKDKHLQNCLGCFNIPLWNENHSFKITKKKKKKKRKESPFHLFIKCIL